MSGEQMARNPSCEVCGSLIDGEHKEGCETQRTTVTDKRGGRRASDSQQPSSSSGLPVDRGQSTSSLMHQTDDIATETASQKQAEHAAEQSEFEKQRSEAVEDARRAAEWDELTDQEKQDKLAEQAAAEGAGIPYSGAGIETDTDVSDAKETVLCMFAVVVMEDGTALATDNLDLSGYEAKYAVDASKMHRACSEIIKDIETTDAAQMTMRFMNTQMAAMQQQAQTRAAAQQLHNRGVAPGKPGKRGR